MAGLQTEFSCIPKAILNPKILNLRGFARSSKRMKKILNRSGLQICLNY
uniref:Uncharacterized protein n=1 Tax=Anguilla anguilla TaxID=7936 RepID=A0A0E9P8C9_ANGAN